MLSVVCWLWNEGFRDYRPEHVNRLARLIRDRLPIDHRFVCIADSSAGLSTDVEFVKTPAAAAAVGKHRSPEGRSFPSCYRRLWTFSDEARALGERILSIDIDLIPTADWSPLVERVEDFVGWRPLLPWGNETRFNGGMHLQRAGARAWVWENFRGQESIAIARRAGFRGSDQAWISYCLAASEAAWSKADGIYSIRDLKDGRLPLPPDARVVQFNGPTKPWQTTVPWAQALWS